MEFLCFNYSIAKVFSKKVKIRKVKILSEIKRKILLKIFRIIVIIQKLKLVEKLKNGLISKVENDAHQFLDFKIMSSIYNLFTCELFSLVSVYYVLFYYFTLSK